MTSNNSSCSTGGSDAAAGGWLGFSLSPHHMASVDAAADGGASNGVQQQQHHHGGLYYPSPVASSPATYCYALGSSGYESVEAQARNANNAGGAFYPALSSMPLRPDGTLCISDTPEQYHGKIQYTRSL
jgi:AP2-like factor, ANT lineage